MFSRLVDHHPYEVLPGVMKDEAIELFQRFYKVENRRAPEHKRRHKRTQAEMRDETG